MFGETIICKKRGKVNCSELSMKKKYRKNETEGGRERSQKRVMLLPKERDTRVRANWAETGREREREKRH